MIYVNDLPDVPNNCTVNLYADDSMIYFLHKNPQEVRKVLERELVHSWQKAQDVGMVESIVVSSPSSLVGF